MDNYKIFTDNCTGLFVERMENLHKQVKAFLAEERARGRKLHYAKIFLSDIVNQEEELRQSALMQELSDTTNISIIQQAPVNGAKIGILLKTADVESPFVMHSLRLTDDEVMNFNSYIQTVMLFEKYQAILKDMGLTLKDHCVRTWIYVRDIDTNYDGVVKARNDIFRQNGLTTQTHFIASTGIGGRATGRNVTVAIDFLTCPTIKSEDVLYLKALDHLNPTHEYGVAFERGVRLSLPDKQHFFISGTASINHHGEVVNVGNVKKQTERLLENIGALVADGGATLDDVKYFIIYLRDLADASVVEEHMQQFFPNVPRIITYAQVCRPAWLVEMECVL